MGNVTHRQNECIETSDFCGGLNVLYMNARSIRNKLDRVMMLINSFGEHSIHVVIVTETWIKPGEEHLFEIYGYGSFHSVRTSTGGGGVSIYVLATMRAERCLELFENESNFVVVRLPDSDFHVTGFYRPGSATFSSSKFSTFSKSSTSSSMASCRLCVCIVVCW